MCSRADASSGRPAAPTMIYGPSFNDNKLITQKPLDQTDDHEGNNWQKHSWREVKRSELDCFGFERPPWWGLKTLVHLVRHSIFVNSKAGHLKLQMSARVHRIYMTLIIFRRQKLSPECSRGTSSLHTVRCWVQGQAFLKSSGLINNLYFRDLPTDTLTDSCSRGKPAGERSCSVMGHFLKSSIYKAEISPHTETLYSSGSVLHAPYSAKPEINWHWLFSYSL